MKILFLALSLDFEVRNLNCFRSCSIKRIKCTRLDERLKCSAEKSFLTDIIFVLSIRSVHHLQKFDFDLRLIQERLLILDDLYRNVTLLLVIECLHHLSKTSLAC